MYGVIGMICMCLCGTAPADSVVTSEPYQPIELVSAGFEKIPADELVTSKRIAPQPAIGELIDKAITSQEPPAPSLPSAAASKIATTKVVVDEILQLKPADDTEAQTEDVDDTFVVPSRHQAANVVEAVEEIPASPEPVVVDIDDSTSNLFVVPDPSDDQFITDPQPISVEFQDQLERTSSKAETDSVEVVKSAETSTEQLNLPEEPTETITTEELSESEMFTAPETNHVVDSPEESQQLVEVMQSWTSLSESTRQAILMLVEADLMTHQLTTQQ